MRDNIFFLYELRMLEVKPDFPPGPRLTGGAGDADNGAIFQRVCFKEGQADGF